MSHETREAIMELVHQYAGDDRLDEFDAAITAHDEAVRREVALDYLKHLVLWRCWNCRHDLYGIPDLPFGPCLECGMEGHGHQLFSDDREGLLEKLYRAAGIPRSTETPTQEGEECD